MALFDAVFVAFYCSQFCGIQAAVCFRPSSHSISEKLFLLETGQYRRYSLVQSNRHKAGFNTPVHLQPAGRFLQLTRFRPKKKKMKPTTGARRPSAAHKDRIQLYKTPPSHLKLVHDRVSRKLVVSATQLPQQHTTASHILAESSSAVRSFFDTAHVSPNRLIYITAGLIFKPSSPLPFGGHKSRPGYLDYAGATVESLLEYILTASFKRYWSYRGREAIDFVTENLNEAMKLHIEQDRDLLNELMLVGIKRVGHSVGAKGVLIPAGLEHVDQLDSRTHIGVTFTPRRRGVPPILENKDMGERGCQKKQLNVLD
ncbi:hypothetical protein BJ741DRAFT_593798 [Chytriomyces cf. hyalinus JEL632]|nr:hypothetical protein BJ741DRAFT_593798 [Chytriomyces cf. hyalinus JEL632]